MSVLEMSNVKYEAISVNLIKAENKTEEYLKINPKGQVPTVVINGQSYLESAATMRLLV